MKLTAALGAMFLGAAVAGTDATAVQKAETPPPSGPQTSRVMIARFTAQPITVDGVLDEPVWKGACVYDIGLSQTDAAKGQVLHEGGRVRLAWDTNFVYVGVELTDSDIVAEGNDDQLHHYQLGDVLEVFLKPEILSSFFELYVMPRSNKIKPEIPPWYFELYVTPRGNKTWFFLQNRKILGPEDVKAFTVKTRCRGTLNEGTDIDQSWSAEMAIPVSALTSRGETFGPASPWRILVARYNYSRQLPIPWLEYSMVPALRVTDFHRLDEYGLLKLEP